MDKESVKEVLICNFCHKTEGQVRMLLAGVKVEGMMQAHICDRCVTGSVLIIDRHVRQQQHLVEALKSAKKNVILDPDKAIELIENKPDDDTKLN